MLIKCRHSTLKADHGYQCQGSVFLYLVFVLQLFLSVFVVLPATANGQDIENSNDVSLFKRFPNSFIVNYSQSSSTEYTLAIGKLKKINGVWSAEKEKIIKGELTRITYRIPDGGKRERVLGYVLQELVGATVLYECVSRACGSSNQWANGIFKIKKLYGPDKHQAYSVMQFDREGERFYVALYMIERGNKRIFLHVDVLRVPGLQVTGSQAVDLPEHALTGRSGLVATRGSRLMVPIEALNQESTEDKLKLIRALLEQSADLQIYVVGHSYLSRDLSAAQEKSRGYAKPIAARLQELGVPSARMQVSGVGFLSPLLVNADSKSLAPLVQGQFLERVEIVFY